MVNKFITRRASADGFAQAHQLSGTWRGQAQRLSESTAQPETQPSDGGGSSGWFVGIGLLVAVLLAVTFFRNRPRSGSSGKKVGGKTAAPIFTAKDRPLIELLSEVVDIISSVEK